MEGSLIIVVLSEWMEDDVDHSELFIVRVDFVIHSELLFAQVLPVFRSESYFLAKHMLVHVSRIMKSEGVLGRSSPFFQSGQIRHRWGTCDLTINRIRSDLAKLNRLQI